MSNTQYGFVSGTVFTLVNSFSGIFMGYQVDKFNRKYMLIICGFLWNLISYATYYVGSYEQLLLVRMGFAILSSVHTPACISLINDYFDHEDRARANSVYVTAVSVGVGCANLTSLINSEIGWRNSVIVVSIIGLFVTLLCCFLEEPRR